MKIKMYVEYKGAECEEEVEIDDTLIDLAPNKHEFAAQELIPIFDKMFRCHPSNKKSEVKS